MYYVYVMFAVLLLCEEQYSAKHIIERKFLLTRSVEHSKTLSKRGLEMCTCPSLRVTLCSCGCAKHKCCRTCSCFPGDGHLLRDNGKIVLMKNLKAGDVILTVRDGQPVFSTVRTFLKREPYQNSTYLSFITDQGNHVTMSDSHNIFVSTNNFTSMESRLAMSVKTGDYIFTTKSCPRGMCPERVAQIAISTKQGMYVPLTDTGTIVVNGMVASCYAILNHAFSHAMTTPYRWFPWILEPWEQNGYSPIVSYLERISPHFVNYKW